MTTKGGAKIREQLRQTQEVHLALVEWAEIARLLDQKRLLSQPARVTLLLEDLGLHIHGQADALQLLEEVAPCLPLPHKQRLVELLALLLARFRRGGRGCQALQRCDDFCREVLEVGGRKGANNVADAALNQRTEVLEGPVEMLQMMWMGRGHGEWRQG